MRDSTKALLAVLGVGAAVAGIILWTRRERAQAEASLVIIPGQVGAMGRVEGIGAMPAVLTEGVAGNLAVVTITNNSLYTGTSVKAPWTFPCIVRIAYGGNIINVGGNCALGAGETKAFSFAFDLPYGYSGSGTAKGVLYAKPGDTSGIAQTAEVGITVAAAAITPGGGLIW